MNNTKMPTLTHSICKVARSIVGLAFALVFWAALPFSVRAGTGDPYIAYAYPAGGRQGDVVQVAVAGQLLRGAREVLVSGTGVHGKIVEYVGPGGLLTPVQQETLRLKLESLMKKPAAKAGENAKTGKNPSSASTSPGTSAGTQTADTALPDLPELRDLDTMSPAQLRMVYERFLNFANRPKPPLNEIVTLEISIDRSAPAGNRELRILSSKGLSNPVVFQVGLFKEIMSPGQFDLPPETTPAPLAAPVVLNGQILPGEVDSFHLFLHKDEQVSLVAQARSLIPYLADAVPGWFQAVMYISNASGTVLAYCDDYGFDPDPRIDFTAPADGVYSISIRDSIYRGRQDFVYRIYVAGREDIAALFPAPSVAPSTENEPNDSSAQAQSIGIPSVIRGEISYPGDTDFYKFDGHAGESIVASIDARKSGSLLDSLIRLYDASGKQIATNDDFPDKELGLVTNQSDSYLRFTVPSNGKYYIEVSDVLHHGGVGYFYTFHLARPHGDFSVLTSQSAINIPAKGTCSFTVYAVRKDGWNGDITVQLVGAPQGIVLDSGTIPAGKDSAILTISGRAKNPFGVYKIGLECSTSIDGATVTHEAIPADEKMQAFAYTHLVHASSLELAFATGK
jgi:hypothetical protein